MMELWPLEEEKNKIVKCSLGGGGGGGDYRTENTRWLAMTQGFILPCQYWFSATFLLLPLLAFRHLL